MPNAAATANVPTGPVTDWYGSGSKSELSSTMLSTAYAEPTDAARKGRNGWGFERTSENGGERGRVRWAAGYPVAPHTP
ncbi:hypothetical protein GCM10009863_00360 [Streptomyces axinellae]|uniref:Uncharacterized protein n=1 Tax=Streptomyces axinellae TaxID=552788 RepID=A0ABN3PNQ7_9ACTN